MTLLTPELVTSRLRLVAPAADFADDVFAYSKDEEFCRHIDASPPLSVAESREFLEGLVRDNAANRRCYWVVQERASGRAIGTLGFLFLADQKYSCQCGYGIARARWGAGLFQEALGAALDYGFGALGLERVFAVTRRANRRSVCAVEKLGFRMTDEISDYYPGNADPTATVLSLSHEDWPTRLATASDERQLMMKGSHVGKN